MSNVRFTALFVSGAAEASGWGLLLSSARNRLVKENAMSWIGDIALESTFDIKFTTVDTTGAPTTLAGSPVISAYVGNSVTQITAGITLTVDFDGITGLHNVNVVATAANGYATASNYQLVITTGTVDGTSVVGYVVDEFSIEARSGLIADAVWDEVLTGATHNVTSSSGKRLRQLVGTDIYEGAAVHIDTVNGAAGTTVDVNGTSANPSSNIADATTIAVALNLKNFKIRNSSSITLAQAYVGYDFIGENWTLALGGQSVTDCFFSGATVSGTCSGTGMSFEKGSIDTSTIPAANFIGCGVLGTMTLATGTYNFYECYSKDMADLGFTLDFVAAVGATAARMHMHSGEVIVQNLKTGDEFAMNGFGSAILQSSCTAGDVLLTGNIRLVDSSTGVTLTDSSRFSNTELVDDILDEAATTVVGKPGTLRQLIWFMRKIWSNKRTYNKSTDVQTIYEDDGTTPMLTHTMTDNSTTAERGASS